MLRDRAAVARLVARAEHQRRHAHRQGARIDREVGHAAPLPPHVPGVEGARHGVDARLDPRRTAAETGGIQFDPGAALVESLRVDLEPDQNLLVALRAVPVAHQVVAARRLAHRDRRLLHRLVGGRTRGRDPVSQQEVAPGEAADVAGGVAARVADPARRDHVPLLRPLDDQVHDLRDPQAGRRAVALADGEAEPFGLVTTKSSCVFSHLPPQPSSS